MRQPLENLDLDYDLYAVHYIQVEGYSKNPVVNYYYGMYRVIMRRAAAAPSVAFSFFRDSLNIPYADQQTFVVRDRFGDVVDDIDACTEYDARESSIVRKDFYEPRSMDFTSFAA